MKSPIPKQTALPVLSAVVVALILSTSATASAADKTTPPQVAKMPPPALQVDPNTGLPVQPPSWIDANWKDPDKILAEVRYDGLPVSDVVNHLRKEFNNAFDVLIPNGWQDPNNPELLVDAQSTAIYMELRNVRASEVFNAMNMKFEAENAPYRWELMLNGSRPTAMLRILPQLLHYPNPPTLEPKARMVYFVGDLIGDASSGKMTMEQLVKTVSEVYKMSYGESQNVVQFHKDAQLIIVTGTTEQTRFIQLTLGALREKARKPVEPNPKPDSPKSTMNE